MKVKVYALEGGEADRHRWRYVAWCPKCKVNPTWMDFDYSFEGAYKAAEAHARSYIHKVRR